LVNDTSTIIGFTIQNGNASHGGGIYVDEGSPIIEKNNIINNNATIYGGGIYIYKSSPTIIGNTIIGNKASTNGGGIYVRLILIRSVAITLIRLSLMFILITIFILFVSLI